MDGNLWFWLLLWMAGMTAVLLLVWRRPGVFLWPVIMPAPVGVGMAMSGSGDVRAGLAYVVAIVVAIIGCRVLSARHRHRNNT